MNAVWNSRLQTWIQKYGLKPSMPVKKNRKTKKNNERENIYKHEQPTSIPRHLPRKSQIYWILPKELEPNWIYFAFFSHLNDSCFYFYTLYYFPSYRLLVYCQSFLSSPVCHVSRVPRMSCNGIIHIHRSHCILVFFDSLV